MRVMLLLLVLMLSSTAKAAPCMPGEDTPGYVSVVGEFNLTDTSTGPYVVWECLTTAVQPLVNAKQSPMPSVHCLEDTWANVTLRMLGDRADTVKRTPAGSAERLAAFNASVARQLKVPDSARCKALISAYKQKHWVKKD